MKTYSGIIRLVVLIIIVPLLIWVFALRDTSHLYRQKCIVQKKSHSILFPTSIKQPDSSFFSEPILSNGKILQVFEDSLSKLNLEIIKYTPELIDSEGECRLYIGKLLLGGRYIELVNMISIIEKAVLPLRIVSLAFEYERKKRKPPFFVTMTVLIEQIET